MSITFPLEEPPPGASTQERKARRREEIRNWLNHFTARCQADGACASFLEETVDRLNGDYWEVLEESVRPRVVRHDGSRGHIDRHKIASLFELLIAKERPILHESPEVADDLNARFAFFVAINIIASWNGISGADLFVSESFDREHRAWLRQLSRHNEGWPIFSNAATWYLVELIYLDRARRAA